MPGSCEKRAWSHCQAAGKFSASLLPKVKSVHVRYGWIVLCECGCLWKSSILFDWSCLGVICWLVTLHDQLWNPRLHHTCIWKTGRNDSEVVLCLISKLFGFDWAWLSTFVFQLLKAIKYFHDLDQRILIIGREHMRSWNSANYKGVSWFYTSNMWVLS